MFTHRHKWPASATQVAGRAANLPGAPVHTVTDRPSGLARSGRSSRGPVPARVLPPQQPLRSHVRPSDGAPLKAAVAGLGPAALPAAATPALGVRAGHGTTSGQGVGQPRPRDVVARADGGNGAGAEAADGDVPREAVPQRQAWHRPDVGVVLVHPQIPQNTGNVARTCAATGTPLHLVAPLGFELDDRKLKRAGLDYWDSVCMSVHASWDDFFAYFQRLPGPKRLVAFTVYGTSYYAGPEFRYQPGDWLVFGAETSGLPPQAHADVEASGGALVKIPIRDSHVRSINLAVAAGVGLFEAIRQLDEGAHEVAPRLSPTLEEVAAAHVDGRPLASPGQRSAA